MAFLFVSSVGGRLRGPIRENAVQRRCRQIARTVVMSKGREEYGKEAEEFRQTSQSAKEKVYTSIPLDKNGDPMIRVLVVGSEDDDKELARIIKEHPAVTGLYYACDREGVCDVEMSKLAQTAPALASDSEAWIGFCVWARVNVVFLGPKRELKNMNEIEQRLAERQITFFTSDVSEAVLNKAVTVDSCVAGQVESLKEEYPKLYKRSEELMREAGI